MRVKVREFVSKLLRRRVYVPLLVLYGVYVLFAWLWLPQIVQTQAVKFIETKTAHHLTMDKPSFNPFTIDLHLYNLHLTASDGKDLFSFRELELNLSSTSVLRLATIFDSIRLDGAEVDVTLLRNGGLNWTSLVDELSGKDSKPKQEAGGLPRLAIKHFVLSNGHLNFADENADFHSRVEPINLELMDLSSLPDSEGIYSVVAQTEMGAQISWKGRMELNPVTVTGTFNINNFDLAQLATYLEKYLPGKPLEGVFDFSTEYQLKHNRQQLGLTLSNVAFRFRDFQLQPGKSLPDIAIATIEAKGGHFDQLANTAALDSLVLNGSEITAPRGDRSVKLVQLNTLAIENAQVNMGTRNASLRRLALDTGEVNAVRNRRGEVDLLAALHGISSTTAAPSDKKGARTPATKPWHYRVGKIDMEKFSVAFHDESVDPAAHLALDDIALHVEGISDNLAAPLPVQLSLKAPDGGALEVGGSLVPVPVKVDMQIKLEGLALKPARPYIASVSHLALVDGQFSTAGHATYDKHGGKYKGNFKLNNLRLLESNSRETFLAWRTLGTRALTVTQDNLNIGSLDIERLESKLIINKDKTVNVSNIMKKPNATNNAVAADSTSTQPVGNAPPAGENTATAAPREFITNIDRIRIRNSTMTFADHSLMLPFDTRIHHMRANINNISSRPNSIGQLEMNGQVDDYGTAQANGQINLFHPVDLLNMEVLFSNIEMTRMTPYSTTFAGRRIDSGKLTLDLSYDIKERQLTGSNKITIDRLTLGERVKSPTAIELPLDLAIAILQDADGRIDLGLPVSGSLDDPQFSYGGIVMVS